MHSTVHSVEVHDKLCVIITCNSVESQRWDWDAPPLWRIPCSSDDIDSGRVLLLTLGRSRKRTHCWLSVFRGERFVLQLDNAIGQDLCRSPHHVDHARVPGLHLSRVERLGNIGLCDSWARSERFTVAEENFAKDQTVSIHERDSRHFREVDSLAEHSALVSARLLLLNRRVVE